MTSNYNSRPLAAEVLFHGKTHQLVRRRQNYADLMQLETDERTNEPQKAAEPRRGRVCADYSQGGIAAEVNYSKVLRGNW
jgi:hypothetical protein